MMKKRKSHAFRKDIYLLGADEDGVLYWLEEATWDCNWYWGLGYIETYTNNRNPACAKDKMSHSHFSTFEQKANMFDGFKALITDPVVTDKELWTLCELMKSAYLAKEYAAMLKRGSAHYTTNPCEAQIQNAEERTRINKVVIPSLMQEVYKILDPDAKKEEDKA